MRPRAVDGQLARRGARGARAVTVTLTVTLTRYITVTLTAREVRVPRRSQITLDPVRSTQ